MSGKFEFYFFGTTLKLEPWLGSSNIGLYLTPRYSLIKLIINRIQFKI